MLYDDSISIIQNFVSTFISIKWNLGMMNIIELFHVCDIVILHIYIFFASHTPMIMHNWVYSTSSSISSISCNTIIDLHHEEGDDVYSWHDFSDFWFNERNILSPRHKKYFSSIYIKIIVYEKSDRVDVALFHRKDDRIMGYFFCIVLVKNIDRLIIVTWHWDCYV